MAMTKKERAEFDAAIKRAETLAALRWTQPVARDLPRPDRGMTSGWDFNVYSGEVFRAWSECTSHGRGPRREFSGSQNGRALFSTRALALAALRHETEAQCAESLRRIDEMAKQPEPKDES